MTDFWVLLGTDYVGKSSLLEEISARETHVLPVSSDTSLMTEQYQPLVALRELLGTAVSGPHSPDYVMALLNVAVSYQWDRIFMAPDGRTLLLDSYYYKILAKSRLLGLGDGPWQPYWESLPDPAGVIFLDVDTDTAWRRAGRGDLLNPLEHYGRSSTKAAFVAFQRDLRTALLDAVRHLCVEHVPTGLSVSATADHVLRAMKE